MSQSVTFFLPVRKGSQRVINKSTRRFSDLEGGLLELKLSQLLESKKLDQILLSTNDEVAIAIAEGMEDKKGKLRIVPRPDELCLDSTPLSQLIAYVPTVVDTDHILWGHVTTPFVDAFDYDRILERYFLDLERGYDSLLSVCPFQNFLLNEQGKVFNSDSKEFKWPRTQDLPKLFEVNHAVFLAPKSVYQELKNRLGENPSIYEMDKIKSWDIDWEEDFTVAEAIYEKLRRL